MDLIEKAINSFKIPKKFGIDFSRDETSEEVEYADCCVHSSTSGYIANGISKAVIIIPNSEYVVKIPFNGAFDRPSVYNEKTKDYEEGEEREFFPFEQADDLESDEEAWDYCANELLKYENAVAAGFGEFFPETRYYREKDGFPLYLQEKCSTFPSCSKKPSEQAREKSRTNNKLRCKANSEWIAAAVDWYGEERVEQFVQYINDTGIDTDLHDGNLGFGSKGNPVILDFSGYREDF